MDPHLTRRDATQAAVWAALALLLAGWRPASAAAAEVPADPTPFGPGSPDVFSLALCRVGEADERSYLLTYEPVAGGWEMTAHRVNSGAVEFRRFVAAN